MLNYDSSIYIWTITFAVYDVIKINVSRKKKWYTSCIKDRTLNPFLLLLCHLKICSHLMDIFPKRVKVLAILKQ